MLNANIKHHLRNRLHIKNKYFLPQDIFKKILHNGIKNMYNNYLAHKIWEKSPVL